MPGFRYRPERWTSTLADAVREAQQLQDSTRRKAKL